MNTQILRNFVFFLMLHLSSNHRAKPGEPVAQPSSPASVSEATVCKGLQEGSCIPFVENSNQIGQNKKRNEKLGRGCLNLVGFGTLILILVKAHDATY